VTTVRRARLPKPKKKVGYHHDDLRRALLDATVVHLRSRDVTSLTMQSLARAAGVSPGAPYHHFADKVEVLAALAEEGFAIWLAQAERAVSGAAQPLDALTALAQSWLNFAASHLSHYRVMFLPDVADRVRFAGLHATSGRGLQLLVGALSRLDPDAAEPQLLARAVSAWSTLHGFASLKAAGVLGNIPGLPPVDSLEAQVIRGVVDW
jgi:AcrR family transcriptional regulator